MPLLAPLTPQVESLETALRLEKERSGEAADQARAAGDAAIEKQQKQQATRLTMMEAELEGTKLKLSEAEDRLTAATAAADRASAKSGKELEAMAAKVSEADDAVRRCAALETAMAAAEARAKAAAEGKQEAEAMAARAADAADALQVEMDAASEKLRSFEASGELQREVERLREAEAELVEQATAAKTDAKGLEERLKRAVNESNMMRDEVSLSVGWIRTLLIQLVS